MTPRDRFAARLADFRAVEARLVARGLLLPGRGGPVSAVTSGSVVAGGADVPAGHDTTPVGAVGVQVVRGRAAPCGLPCLPRLGPVETARSE